MNRKNTFFIALFLFLLGIPSSLLGQDYTRQYQEAKNLFAKKEYGAAMRSFEPLMEQEGHSYTRYALFYYAVSAYHQGYPVVAKNTFLQIKKIHPKWNQLEEVNYWLAHIYFQQFQYFQAMHLLKNSSSGSLKNDVEQMKDYYLQGIQDVETLRMMLEEWSEDREVAKALVRTIDAHAFSVSNASLRDSLITKFDLNPKELKNKMKQSALFKDRYTVSLLFPFLVEDIEPTVSPKMNQSVLDLYRGIDMACDSLEARGVYIDLRLYDTRRSLSTTLDLLNLEELGASDLLVGPLFPNQIAPVREFSRTHRIPMVSPVSGDTTFLRGNPYSLLYLPDYNTIGERSAEWIFLNTSNHHCMIFFGENVKDFAMVRGFLKRADELGLVVTFVNRVLEDSSSEIFDLFSAPNKVDEEGNTIEFELQKDSIGSVFVASQNPLLYTKVISGVDARNDEIIIVGHQNWLNNSAANYEKYERMHITMAAPHFYPMDSPHYKAFLQIFMEKYGVVPDEYAKIGYEFMLFIGYCMEQYGVYFQNELTRQEFIEGCLSPGYSYRGARSNQYIPFIRFNQGKLSTASEE